MVNLRDFLRNITCQSECCRNNDIRTTGQGNNVNLTIDIKEPKIIKVKDEEIQSSTPTTQSN